MIMISPSFLVSMALIPSVFAQSTNMNVEIAGVEANFANAGLVPSLLKIFTPSAIMHVVFENDDIVPGTPLTQEQVKPAPSFYLTPANSSVNFAGKFTLAMVDAGPVGADESQGQTRHLLINGVTVTGTNVSTDSGVPVTTYAGPAPPAGSGPHRYVIMLYTQPDSFSPPANLSQPNAGVSVFDFTSYVETSKLGPLIAANYFTVEVGTASVSISPTSPVVSSTLSVASSGTTSASSAQVSNKSSSALTIKASCLMVLATPLLVLLFS